jgi:hypothetical protein
MSRAERTDESIEIYLRPFVRTERRTRFQEVSRSVRQKAHTGDRRATQDAGRADAPRLRNRRCIFRCQVVAVVGRHHPRNAAAGRVQGRRSSSRRDAGSACLQDLQRLLVFGRRRWRSCASPCAPSSVAVPIRTLPARSGEGPGRSAKPFRPARSARSTTSGTRRSS